MCVHHALCWLSPPLLIALPSLLTLLLHIFTFLRLMTFGFLLWSALINQCLWCNLNWNCPFYLSGSIIFIQLKILMYLLLNLSILKISAVRHSSSEFFLPSYLDDGPFLCRPSAILYRGWQFMTQELCIMQKTE